MLATLIDLIKKYLFPPLYGKVVLALLALAGTALLIAFGADIQFRTEGTAWGTQFSLSYENSASFFPGLLIFIALISLAIWIFFKAGSPPLPRSEQISKLEEAYCIKGHQDSVCTLFREVHGVFVSSDELDDLMRKNETSTRARSLKQARSHVEFSLPDGFKLKNPSYPYRFLSAFFTGIYFFAAMLCLPFVSLTAAAIASSSLIVAANCVVAMFLLAAISWASLKAYSACNSALSLTSI
jgi:ABC-type multidrug transport system fused ATPase/permease subunit